MVAGFDPSHAPWETGRPVRRVVLWLLLVSVGVNAIAGVSALLVGSFGEVHLRIIFTSLSVSGAAILALICTLAWERRTLAQVPIFGGIASVSGFALLVASIWSDFAWSPLWKLAVTLIVVGTAVAHGSLLALARLAARFWILVRSAYVLDAMLSTLIIAAIWIPETDGPWLSRVLGILAVLVAAASVAVPVTARLGGTDRPERAPSRAQVIAFCPSCGQSLASTTQVNIRARCAVCGFEFEVLAS